MWLMQLWAAFAKVQIVATHAQNADDTQLSNTTNALYVAGSKGVQRAAQRGHDLPAVAGASRCALLECNPFGLLALCHIAACSNPSRQS